ncbi:MAG: hypothetical protein II625_03000 [Bacilli bacterium]|nr:hypothetical protein [Bacilli bacterium]
MQSYNKTVKSKTVPVFITICGIAIIGSAILGARNSFSAKIDDSKVVESNKEVINIDKVDVNKKLNELQYSINYALDGERTVEKGTGNVLKFDSEKIRFAFMVASQEGNNTRIERNVSPEGAGVTGYVAIDKEYFIDYYQDLFHAGINEEIMNELYVEKDGYLYGSVMSGLMMSTETYKVNKVYKSGDSFEIVIDVLTVNYDDESSIAYMSETVTDYPESAVAYQMTLNVSPGELVYTIDSLVA